MSAAARKNRLLVVDDDRAFRHAIATLLAGAGHDVLQAAEGAEALALLRREPIDAILLDVSLPGMSGLDVLSGVRALKTRPRVVIVSADDTSEMLIKAVQGQADHYVRKPFPPASIVEIVDEVLKAPPASELPVEVVSARPDWVEIVAPCSLDVANRLQAFMMHLEGNLSDEVRESVGQAFRELLCNAIEWGGKLDPSRHVRISCLRAKRMLLYRIADPGEGFDIESLSHAAINNPDDNPLQHATVREERGLRPGGLGLAIIRSIVDELIYNEARNEVVFVKYLDA